MIYFSLNINEFSKELKENIGEISWCFLNQLLNKFPFINIESYNVLSHVICVPRDSHGIDDESEETIYGLIKYILLESEKMPIKQLNNKSLKDFGININILKRIANEKLNNTFYEYMEKNNLQYLQEEVLWKNMTQREKIQKFSKWLAKIESVEKELIIVDPYLLKSTEKDYCDMLAEIINMANASKIIIVTDKKNYKQESEKKIFRNYSNFEIKYSSDFHDRFWISGREKGFYTGTSFNGVGKRISLINDLSSCDIKEIVDELTKCKII